MTTELEQRLREALQEDAQRAQLVNPDGPPAPEARQLALDQPRRPSARKVVAAAAAVALLAAVAGVAVTQDGDGGPDVTASLQVDPEDQAIAAAAVLTPADMPSGWEAAPPEVEAGWQAEAEDLDQAMADCLGVDVSELEDDAPSAQSDFVNVEAANDERVVSKVTAFATEAEARAVTDRFRGEDAPRCYVAALAPQIAEGAGDGVTTLTGRNLAGDVVEIGEPTVGEISWEYLEDGYWKTVTDDSVALRVTVPLSVDGVDVDVYADVAFVRKGRFLTQTSFQTYFLGFDGGPAGSSLVGSPTAVQLTREVLERLPGTTSPDPVRTVDPVVGSPSGPLTEPGEQPADPAAAEEQVRAAFTGIFDSSLPREAKAPLSERPAVWAAANQALVEGQYGEMVEGLHAVVDEVVFTSPTRAVVRFDLITSTGYRSADQIGHAVLVDGRWLVTIETTCEQVSIAGVRCDMSL
jgi:hypothetical protein